MNNNLSHCNNCLSVPEDIVYVMRYGCILCGGRKFTTISDKKQEKNDIINNKFEDVLNKEIGIHILSTGKYNINLHALTKRKTNIEPVIIQDKNGIVNIILDPED